MHPEVKTPCPNFLRKCIEYIVVGEWKTEAKLHVTLYFEIIMFIILKFLKIPKKNS
jgi:hypothetical protein